ncbi:hypothetical protein QYE76_011627 [Lolium multiflorum]|uniref:Reverse transcriptase Ty1/copia-type domain-containing protein n=1 Tax=Lolium multiflorum TaxID=4521 RepID=A0AAD8TVQ5_LOLMU|nr:hypothetical protein QYE76_011627 [Lolium multiflorum]
MHASASGCEQPCSESAWQAPVPAASGSVLLLEPPAGSAMGSGPDPPSPRSPVAVASAGAAPAPACSAEPPLSPTAPTDSGSGLLSPAAPTWSRPVSHVPTRQFRLLLPRLHLAPLHQHLRCLHQLLQPVMLIVCVVALRNLSGVLTANGTWNLVPPVAGVNLIDSRWVFKVKLHADGSVERYKARLVAKGFKQRYGQDYDETFIHVVKPVTIHLFLSMALSRRWHIRQLDIQNVFLNGFLDEEVYMRQPPGFVDSDKPDHYCKLVRSLYGLKQAPRAWHARLTSVLSSLGFSPSMADTSLFILCRNDVTVYLLVYVDDIIVLSSTSAAIPRLISQLRSEFSVKGLGVLHYFLGIESTVSKSSTESEYEALGNATAELVWVQSLLHELGVVQARPPVLWARWAASVAGGRHTLHRWTNGPSRHTLYALRVAEVPEQRGHACEGETREGQELLEWSALRSVSRMAAREEQRGVGEVWRRCAPTKAGPTSIPQVLGAAVSAWPRAASTDLASEEREGRGRQ